jgi:hypothetical protein
VPVNFFKGLLLGFPHYAKLDSVTFNFHAGYSSSKRGFFELDYSALGLLPVEFLRVLVDIPIDDKRTT